MDQNNNINNNNNNLSAYVNYNYEKKNYDHLNFNSTTTATSTNLKNHNEQPLNNDNYSFKSNSFLSSLADENSYRDNDTEYRQKLNEYKQIIEDTYLNHVINKKAPEISNDVDQQFLNNYSNKERKMSIDTLIVTNRSLSNSINSLSEFESYKHQNSGTAGTANIGVIDTASKDLLIQPCTIQYMSAYNIYQPIEEHPLLQEQNKYHIDEELKKLEIHSYEQQLSQKHEQQQPYDSESSSLSSPIQQQVKQVNDTNLKKPSSPRVRLRLYQNSEDNNKTVVGKPNGSLSSNSRSSSSPNYINNVKPKVQPHPPLTQAPFSSARSSASSRTKAYAATIKTQNEASVHEVKPPSARKVNFVPNYRKKMIKKATRDTNNTAKAPTPATNSQYNTDSTNSEFNTCRTNDTTRDFESKEHNNLINENRARQFNGNYNMVVPDLIQNCLDEKQVKQDHDEILNRFFEKKNEISSNSGNIIKENISQNKPNLRKSSSESSDSEDTLNMISSAESFHKKTDSNQNNGSDLKKFNLAINLDDLSDDDEDRAAKNVNKNLIPKIKVEHDHEEDDIMIMPNQSQFKQVKPSYIPNLMLCDPNDDDKSVSVAASLAVSMCNEIDYQKEMEKINDQILASNTNQNVNSRGELVKQVYGNLVNKNHKNSKYFQKLSLNKNKN